MLTAQHTANNDKRQLSLGGHICILGHARLASEVYLSCPAVVVLIVVVVMSHGHPNVLPTCQLKSCIHIVLIPCDRQRRLFALITRSRRSSASLFVIWFDSGALLMNDHWAADAYHSIHRDDQNAGTIRRLHSCRYHDPKLKGQGVLANLFAAQFTANKISKSKRSGWCAQAGFSRAFGFRLMQGLPIHTLSSQGRWNIHHKGTHCSM